MAFLLLLEEQYDLHKGTYCTVHKLLQIWDILLKSNLSAYPVYRSYYSSSLFACARQRRKANEELDDVTTSMGYISKIMISHVQRSWTGADDALVYVRAVVSSIKPNYIRIGRWIGFGGRFFRHLPASDASKGTFEREWPCCSSWSVIQ